MREVRFLHGRRGECERRQEGLRLLLGSAAGVLGWRSASVVLSRARVTCPRLLTLMGRERRIDLPYKDQSLQTRSRSSGRRCQRAVARRIACLVFISGAVLTAAFLSAAALASGALLSQVRIMQDHPRLWYTTDAFVPRGLRTGVEQTELIAHVDPLARLAIPNAVVRPFRTAFVYDVVNSHELQLRADIVGPVNPRLDSSPGGCSACVGPGYFRPYHVYWHGCGRHMPAPCFIDRVHGFLSMGPSTTLYEAVTRPGWIGRFAMYRLQLHPSVKPVRVRADCLGADVRLPNLFWNYPLPAVPCQARVPHDGPLVLTGTPSSFTITGPASGTRWLTVFQGQARCRPDAWAQAATGEVHFTRQVQSPINVSFAAHNTPPGNFCVYLQIGGTYRNLPDGRVTWSGSLPRDTVSISGPSSTPALSSVTDTFAGNASVSGEYLWVLDAYSPCATTAQAEHQDPSWFSDYHTPTSVAPAFSYSITSFHDSTHPSMSFYRCAYLQSGPPDGSVNQNPTGSTLATASYFITVP